MVCGIVDLICFWIFFSVTMCVVLTNKIYIYLFIIWYYGLFFNFGNEAEKSTNSSLELSTRSLLALLLTIVADAIFYTIIKACGSVLPALSVRILTCAIIL